MKFGKDSEQVPAEVQQYYKEQGRGNQGKAWLLAIGTLLITVAVALGLFFAGRYVYRAVTDRGDNRPQPAVTQSPDEGKQEAGQTSSTSTSQPSTNESNTTSVQSSTTSTPTTSSATSLPNTAGEVSGAEL